MNKITYLLIASVISCQANALEITSDANGPVTLSEPQLNRGSEAPKISLTTGKFKPQEVGGASDKVQIISTIESFDTEVCDLQTKKLEETAKKYPLLDISIVTANIPFIIDNFQTKNKIQTAHLLSTIDNEAFGKQYGVQVVGGELKGILARSVFVVNKKGTVIYKEITNNIDKMPNLDAAIAAARNASENEG